MTVFEVTTIQQDKNTKEVGGGVRIHTVHECGYAHVQMTTLVVSRVSKMMDEELILQNIEEFVKDENKIGKKEILGQGHCDINRLVSEVVAVHGPALSCSTIRLITDLAFYTLPLTSVGANSLRWEDSSVSGRTQSAWVMADVIYMGRWAKQACILDQPAIRATFGSFLLTVEVFVVTVVAFPKRYRPVLHMKLCHVSYAWLSSNLDIDVDKAKFLVENYAIKNGLIKPGLEVTYLLAGTLKTTGEYIVEVVRQCDLEKVTAQFKEIQSEHIYSVQKEFILKDSTLQSFFDDQIIFDSKRSYETDDIVNHKREMVMLYVPFRCETVDIIDRSVFMETYDAREAEIMEKRKQYESNIDIERVVEELRRMYNQFDDEDPLGARNQREEFVKSIIQQGGVENANDFDAANMVISVSAVRRRSNAMAKADFCRMMRSTNSEFYNFASSLKMVKDAHDGISAIDKNEITTKRDSFNTPGESKEEDVALFTNLGSQKDKLKKNSHSKQSYKGNIASYFSCPKEKSPANSSPESLNHAIMNANSKSVEPKVESSSSLSHWSSEICDQGINKDIIVATLEENHDIKGNAKEIKIKEPEKNNAVNLNSKPSQGKVNEGFKLTKLSKKKRRITELDSDTDNNEGNKNHMKIQQQIKKNKSLTESRGNPFKGSKLSNSSQKKRRRIITPDTSSDSDEDHNGYIHSTNIVAIYEITLSNKTNINVEVEPHRFLNVCKGMVTCFDLDCMSIEEICEGLTHQHVTKIYRNTT
uniref:DNA polymerase delta subunit 3 n=1 Tax=Timema monikensis TaxID=170555 RepID=A0A7R9E030_9NEOP|nr:unnamed protein product [Timema monikensis]